MLHKILPIVTGALLVTSGVHSQSQIKEETMLIQGEYFGKSLPLIDLSETYDFSDTLSGNYIEIKNFKERNRRSPVERNMNPKLDALWQPVNAQRSQRVPTSNLLESYDGIGFTGVNPPDPSLAVSHDHVVQMINGSGGAVYKVYNKIAGSLTGTLSFDQLFPMSGYGDPIVLYDQLANRWFMSEFSQSGNMLMIAISETSSPLGAFHIYTFTAPSFPDYPKYAVWPDAYYCTANESSSSIYAFERDSMLVGAPASMIRKTVSDLSGFGFQTLTPVNFEGTNIPTTPTPATFWRHVDDEAHYPSSADPFTDYVQYWQFVPDFASPTSSTFTGPTNITVTDFDSDLNGYFAFSAIDQPNSSVDLDPLREVFMNRMNYRNFGTHESLVACHVTDVTGNDLAGMRWYEFRKVGATGSWTLFQEGTYSPDSHSRWMGSIDINMHGTICMAYSVSSSSVYPSLRFTGRSVSDPIGTMTLPEQTIIAGSASNASNRYGDYAAMTVDPANDSTYWFTGEYNNTSTWKTRIAHISISAVCNGLTGNVATTGTIDCPWDSTGSVTITSIGGPSGTYQYSLDGVNFQTSNVFTNLQPGPYTASIQDSGCIADIPFIMAGPDSFNIVNTPTSVSCFGDTDGQVYSIATGGTGALQYTIDNMNWYNAGSFNNLSPGAYTIDVKDANNCQVTSSAFQVIEPALLTLSNTIVPSSSSIANDGQIQIHTTGGTPNFSFSLDGLNFYADSLFTGLIAGTYNVEVKDANNCTEDMATELRVTGINDVFTAQELNIYPNPTQGKLRVVLGKVIISSDVNIVITDVTGKIIITKNIDAQNREVNVDFDLSAYAKGFYFMSVTANEKVQTTKIVLE